MHQIKTVIFAAFTLLLAAQGSRADSLQDIYESALQNDPVLRAARATFNADRETKNIARGALLPQLAVSVDYTRSEINDDSNSVIIINGTPVNSSAVSYTHLTLPTTPYV